MNAEGCSATTSVDQSFMRRALELARRGEGRVEPNPMVGCVVVNQGKIVGEGWHRQFGGPHAESEALQAAGDAAARATLYVTLEPCCHTGKTPPCTQAIVAAKIVRVIVACKDPNPQVAGRGVAELRAAGIQVEVATPADDSIASDSMASQAQQLVAPFTKLVTRLQPWIIAKWAMTLDGKLATRTGSSRWISSAASRAVVHELRGRVDAILVGRATAEQDDPLLTARPQQPSRIRRTATRIVLDTAARLPTESQLARTAKKVPVIVASGEHPGDNEFETRCQALHTRGIEVLKLAGNDHTSRLKALLGELGRRQMTNVLVEGGSHVFGSLLDLGAIDEVHAFIGPKLVGGSEAPSPVAGQGIADMDSALQFDTVNIDQLDGDVYVRARRYPH